MTEYRAYLCSKEWKALRTRVRRRARGYCERCKVGKRADIHHLTYERLEHERLENLIAVCAECHEWLHGKRSKDPAATTYTPEEAKKVRFYDAHPDMVDFDSRHSHRDLSACTKRVRSVGVAL